MATYPAGIVSWTNKTDNIDLITASHMNGAYAEIIAIETNLQSINNIPGVNSIAKGGTGQTTAAAAINALLPSQTSNNGKVLGTNGSTLSWVDSGTGNIDLGAYNLTEYTIPGETTTIANLQRASEIYTIMQIQAPTANPTEATLTLMRDVTDAPEFADISMLDYGDPKLAIRVQKRGSGVLRDIVFENNDGTTLLELFRIKANGDLEHNKNSLTDISKIKLGNYGILQDYMASANDALATNRRTLFMHNAYVSDATTNTFTNINGWNNSFKVEMGNNTFKISERENSNGDIDNFTTWTDLLNLSTSGLTIGNLTTTINGGTVWHSGNDGTGSGLDAGLLEGHEASYFAPITHVGSGLTAHAIATQTDAGFMSGSDKLKLDSINEVTGGYEHPATHPATMIVPSTSNFNGLLSATQDTVQKCLDLLDDHVHGVATTSVNGYMSSTDKTKLDGLSTGGYMHPSQHPSEMIVTDTTLFNGILTNDETNVQLALDKIDDHKHDGDYVSLTGDTMTAALIMNAGSGTAINITGGDLVLTAKTSGAAATINNMTGELNIDKEIKVSGNKVRHDGNMIVSSSAPSGGNPGDIWFQYI